MKNLKLKKKNMMMMKIMIMKANEMMIIVTTTMKITMNNSDCPKKYILKGFVSTKIDKKTYMSALRKNFSVM